MRDIIRHSRLVCLFMFLLSTRLAFAACTYPCNPHNCNPYNCNLHSCNPHNCSPYNCNPHLCIPGVPGSGTCYDTCYNTCYDTCYDTCYNTCNDTCNSTASTSCGTPRTTFCNAGTNCTCSGSRRICDTDTDKACSDTCNGLGSCSGICAPGSCDRTDQTIDADGDGFNPACGTLDCNDNNSLIYPNNPNPYCDCNTSGDGVGQGIYETTGCINPITGAVVFAPGCKCLDGIDNDCDGPVDISDYECPNPVSDWIIETDYTLTVNKTVISVYLTSNLTIADGVTLTITNPAVGLRLAPPPRSPRVFLGNNAKILYQ